MLVKKTHKDLAQKTFKSKWLTCGIWYTSVPARGRRPKAAWSAPPYTVYIVYRPGLSQTPYTFSMPPSPPGSLPERDLRFGEGRYYKTVQPFLSTLPYLSVHYLDCSRSSFNTSIPQCLICTGTTPYPVQPSPNPFNSLLRGTLRHFSWLGTPCYLHLRHLPSASVPTMGLRGSFVSSSASSSSSKRQRSDFSYT